MPEETINLPVPVPPKRRVGHNGGRRPLLSDHPEIGAAIIKAITDGAPVRRAARMAGLPDRTLRDWIAFGRAGREPYAQFYAEYKAARHALYKRALDAINATLEDGDGYLALRILATRYPEEWSLARAQRRAAANYFAPGSVNVNIGGGSTSRIDLIAQLRKEARERAEVREAFDRYTQKLEEDRRARGAAEGT